MLHRVASNLRQICSGDLSFFGGPTLDESIAGRVRAEQISVILQYLPWVMLANACNALILVAAFWTSPNRLWALGWSSVIVTYALFYGIKSRRTRDVKLYFVSARTVQRAVRNAFLLGSFWAALPLLFFAGASSGGQLIITCLCAGMLGGGAFAFASVPVAAISFTSPIFMASAFVIARSGDEAYFLVAMLMVVYTCVLLRGVFIHGLKLTSRLVGQIEIEKEVRKDALTNLPNRASFQEDLEGAFSRLTRTGEHFALFYLDLDEFKAVNDKQGHPAGDALLVQIADRLRACKRDIDSLARLSGDEFALIAANVDRPEDALALAEHTVRAFDTPFDIEGTRISSSVSIGIAMAPEDGTDSGSLLKNADTALYSAKRGVGGSVQIFQPEFDTKARERRALANDLRGALQRHEFHLVFQPLLDLPNDRIVGCEALLRWTHPTRGLIPPLEFIQVAEETQLIHSIGEWVIREACRIAAGWPREVKLAVNFSTVQFRKASILPVIVNALADASLAASRLEIEITESVLLSEDDLAFATLNALRTLGVRIALDDFGTGYSSLSYLRTVPLSRIKIDSSFIRDLLIDRNCASIVKFVIGLAGDLGMSVTAEGVETEEQLSCLRAMNCSEAQGNLISVPKSAAEIAVLFGHQQAIPTRAA